MFEQMNELVDDFFKKSDDFIDKMKNYEEEKNKISFDEKPQYEVIDHTFEMNEEEKRKYEEVGKKIDDLTVEIMREHGEI